MYDYNCSDCNDVKLQSDKNTRKINEVIEQLNVLIHNNNETVDFIEEKANEVVGELAEIKVNEVLGDLSAEIDNMSSTVPQNKKKIRDIQLGKGFVAHRGLQSKAPENTLKAIEQAGLNGFIMCELDPAITSDGIWVLMHNPTIDATTNGSGAVAEMTYTQLLQYKIDTPAGLIDSDEIIRIPTFEEAVKTSAYYGIGINIDGGKFRWDYDKASYVYNLLKQYNILEKSCISLPIESEREVFINNFPELCICISIDSSIIDYTLEQYRDYNIIIALNSSLVTDEDINKCNNFNIPVYIWDAQNTQNAYKWLHKGVSFVETDYILPIGGLK